MKTKFLLLLFGCAIVATSFKLAIEKNSATVETQEGIQVFCFAKPVNKYEILGTIKIKGMVKSTRGNYLVKLLVERAKSDYPSSEAIIVSTESGLEVAEAIRFKE